MRVLCQSVARGFDPGPSSKWDSNANPPLIEWPVKFLTLISGHPSIQRFPLPACCPPRLVFVDSLNRHQTDRYRSRIDSRHDHVARLH